MTGEASLNALYYAVLPPQVPSRIRYYLASERLEYEVGSCRADFMNRNGELQFGPFGFNGRDTMLDEGFWIRRVTTNEN